MSFFNTHTDYGSFMRYLLPKNGLLTNESARINLDEKDGPGTHWRKSSLPHPALMSCQL